MKAVVAGLLATAVLVVATSAPGAGQSSANYKIPADVINSGVGDTSSISYKLSASIGESFAPGALSSAGYQFRSGFRAVVAGERPPVALTVTISGNGTVSSSPAGINCPGACSANFAFGAQVVLTAAPNPGSVLAGFANCTSTPGLTCTIASLTTPTTVAATFTASTANPPGPPIIGTGTAGNAQASIAFSPPVSDGGSPVLAYTASCTPGPAGASGAASPITVSGLINDTLYACSVTATNAAGTGVASGSVNVTPSAGAPLALVAVRSRKVHGSAGTYDLPIDSAIALNGLVTVEPRAIGTGHLIVFEFTAPVSAPGTVTVRDAAAVAVGSASALASGSEVQVTITGVPDNKRATITLTGVNGGLAVSASLGFLVGDVNNSRAVTATDILQVKGRSGQTANLGNFRYDVDASGAVNATDVLTVRAQSGMTLQ